MWSIFKMCSPCSPTSDVVVRVHFFTYAYYVIVPSCGLQSLDLFSFLPVSHSNTNSALSVHLFFQSPRIKTFLHWKQLQREQTPPVITGKDAVSLNKNAYCSK